MPTAVITGTNRGIGLELTRQYLADGWRVITLTRNRSPELEHLSESGDLDIIDADLTDDGSLRAATEAIEADAIDLLINNAGTMGDSSFDKDGFSVQAFGRFDRDEWRRVFDINVFTPQALTELLADRLANAEHGVAVTISSMLGSNELNSSGSLYAYRASKAAVNSIMKSMGTDLGKRGVIAVALHPGWVQTDMGGQNADVTVPDSVRGLRNVIADLTPDDAGAFIAYDGKRMPW